MLCFYAVNDAGPSHIKRGICCQDSYAATITPDGFAVAVVCDGVGSQAHSEVSSSAAANAALELIVRNLTPEVVVADCVDDLTYLLYAAMDEALYATVQACAGLEDVEGTADTTFVAVVYDGHDLVWAQAGDSGIVACHSDGTYELAHEQIRDDMGRVWPLCTPEMWETGAILDVASVALATDGVLENLAPPMLRVHGDQRVDTKLCHMFLHPVDGDEDDLEGLSADVSAYLDRFPPSLLDDDKTLVVIFDPDRKPAEQPAPYYDGPDWDAIMERAEAALYTR